MERVQIFPTSCSRSFKAYPTLHSLFVLNLPPPTHPCISHHLKYSFFYFALFPFPFYLLTFSLFHSTPNFFPVLLLYIYFSLQFLQLSPSFQARIIGIKILSAKLRRNWKVTSPKRQDFLQVSFYLDKSSGTIHNSELY